jgi:hypothetical protein
MSVVLRDDDVGGVRREKYIVAMAHFIFPAIGHPQGEWPTGRHCCFDLLSCHNAILNESDWTFQIQLQLRLKVSSLCGSGDGRIGRLRGCW